MNRIKKESIHLWVRVVVRASNEVILCCFTECGTQMYLKVWYMYSTIIVRILDTNHTVKPKKPNETKKKKSRQDTIVKVTSAQTIVRL